jgi:hypothetical protein
MIGLFSELPLKIPDGLRGVYSKEPSLSGQSWATSPNYDSGTTCCLGTTKKESFFFALGQICPYLFVNDLFWWDAAGKSSKQHGHFNLPVHSVSASL